MKNILGNFEEFFSGSSSDFVKDTVQRVDFGMIDEAFALDQHQGCIVFLCHSHLSDGLFFGRMQLIAT